MEMDRMIDNPHYVGMSLKHLLETTDLIDLPFHKESLGLEGGNKQGILKGQDAPYQPNAAFLGPAIWQKSELKLEYLDLGDFLSENNLQKSSEVRHEVTSHQQEVNHASRRSPSSHPPTPHMGIGVPPHLAQQIPLHYHDPSKHNLYQLHPKDRFHRSVENIYESSQKEFYQNSPKNTYQNSLKEGYQNSLKEGYQNSLKEGYQGSPKDSYHDVQRDGYITPPKEEYPGSPKEGYQGSPASSPGRPLSSPVIFPPRAHIPPHDSPTYNQTGRDLDSPVILPPRAHNPEHETPNYDQHHDHQSPHKILPPRAHNPEHETPNYDQHHDHQSPHKMQRSNGFSRMVHVPFTVNESELALATVPGQNFDPRTRAFSDEELKPQPMIRKNGKQFVPIDMKDEKYWVRRTKNNVAAKRSRDARRLKENQIAMRANFLEKENNTLEREIANTRLVICSLKKRLSDYEGV